MNKKVVIIGGVAGGATAAARLRRLDETVEIVILERGEYISYANCGLPYHIGGIIKEREALLLQTPGAMKSKYNIDVRIQNEVIAINKSGKKAAVRNVNTGEEYEESYDFLVIATGSSPLKPPIPGIDGPGIHTLWTIPDTDRIKAIVDGQRPRRAAVIGGGFIGLEMAENLHAAGCEVSIIEMQDQVMAPLDFEMAQLLHENMRMNGVHLHLKDGVKSFSHESGVTTITLQSDKIVEAELVILSIGVKPNGGLAKEAGLELNGKGGVIVSDALKTSDPFIYAVGDVIEVMDFVSKNPAMIPLAGPANKQARICADNIAAEVAGSFAPPKTYKGTQGTSVAQVFDLTAATTGMNEKALIRLGKERNKDYFDILINQKSHAGYYPGASPLTLKLLFTPDGHILGAQSVGQDGVDKRIDVIATAMRMGGTIYDLTELELAYAPPFSSAKDPVNMAGFVAENVLDGLVSFAAWDELERYTAVEGGKQAGTAPKGKETLSKVTILDVTEEFERMAFQIPGSVHIPLGQLRARLTELDPKDTIITYCAIGVRSYNAARILMSFGFEKVKVYPGGTSFYKSAFHDKYFPAPGDLPAGDAVSAQSPGEPGNSEAVNEKQVRSTHLDSEKIVIKKTLDCSGLQCPGPIMRVFNTINEIDAGDIIQVSATDMGFARDIDAWCKRTGNCLLKTERKNKENIVYIQKGAEAARGGADDAAQSRGAGSPLPSTSSPLPQGKTMVVFSGDLDKVLASFIIANGAASMGRPVTMFFTFWGLNALRKAQKQKVKKPLMGRMFGAMMPRGVSKLTLSNMNMGGMGTKMMKKVMQDKNVDSLEALMKQAMKNGVKLVACTMSMDVMGITPEELIDGVELGGVASYLGDAEESNVNLFI